ncbi:hypothetical protein KP509_27G023700 [Ceratopteris richardii]|uniref:Uncharacterized protein n=1 Tax=Ceratopteris richardii TaxID=49495 RepID=A0A8T2RGE9_CERRI|nr:hypothetical protein KP509_27G023700 [Ceratopteris richardii]
MDVLVSLQAWEGWSWPLVPSSSPSNLLLFLIVQALIFIIIILFATSDRTAAPSSSDAEGSSVQHAALSPPQSPTLPHLKSRLLRLASQDQFAPKLLLSSSTSSSSAYSSLFSSACRPFSDPHVCPYLRPQFL